MRKCETCALHLSDGNLTIIPALIPGLANICMRICHLPSDGVIPVLKSPIAIALKPSALGMRSSPT